MSASDKPDPVEAWRFAQKLLADEELARLDKMTDEEVEAELRAEGRDASWIPSAEKLMAGVDGHAAGGDRASEPAPPEVARVIPLRRPARPARVLWLVAAGFALLLGGLAATQGPAIVAWLKGTPERIVPDNEKPLPPTPHELAEKARDAADTACAQELWGTCADRLDEAKKLDPAGEGEERVQRMRAAIHEGTTLKPGPEKKGGR